MFNQYNPQMNIDRLKKQREEIDNLINNYQQIPPQQPINNIINTQTPSQTQFEYRILNENTDIDNLYVQNNTLFVGQNKAILKRVNGEIEKYDIKKTYPIDEKDKKIEELESQIKELKEMINSEYTKLDKSIINEYESNGNDVGNVKPKSKTNIK